MKGRPYQGTFAPAACLLLTLFSAHAAPIVYQSAFTIFSASGSLVNIDTSSISVGDMYTLTFSVDSTSTKTNAGSPDSATFGNNPITVLSILADPSNVGTYSPTWTSTSSTIVIANGAPTQVIDFIINFAGGNSVNTTSTGGDPGTAALTTLDFSFLTNQDYTNPGAHGVAIGPSLPPTTPDWTNTNATFSFTAIDAQSTATITAVPEPTTWALLGLSLVCLAFRRRSRQIGR